MKEERAIARELRTEEEMYLCNAMMSEFPDEDLDESQVQALVLLAFNQTETQVADHCGYKSREAVARLKHRHREKLDWLIARKRVVMLAINEHNMFAMLRNVKASIATLNVQRGTAQIHRMVNTLGALVKIDEYLRELSERNAPSRDPEEDSPVKGATLEGAFDALDELPKENKDGS